MAKTNSRVLTYRSSPEPLLARPPFLARHPWVGFLIFIVCGAAYAWLTWQVLIGGPITRPDPVIIQQIHLWARQQSPAMVLFMRFWSAFGRDGVSLIALFLTFGWARRNAVRELWLLFFGFLAGEIWFQLLGSLVNRHRPVFPDPFETLPGPGFPSGHAVTNVLLGWLVLYLLLPHIRSAGKRALLTIVVVLVVVLILFSRLFLGLHYPTDVLAGVLLGFAWGGFIYTVTDLHFFGRIARAWKQGFRPVIIPAAVPVTGSQPVAKLDEHERS